MINMKQKNGEVVVKLEGWDKQSQNMNARLKCNWH